MAVSLENVVDVMNSDVEWSDISDIFDEGISYFLFLV